MQLSIIIVNYNVKFFLEQCLFSVQKAVIGIDAEILVVDNASNDASISYLQPMFPRFKFIASKTNDGFAKANNQALEKCSGDYIVFLNPDTIVPEDCFKNCIKFFKNHPDCGALGVQMIDGGGHFLPESKRAFPSLVPAFFKLTGMSILFPKSKIFNKYALGNLPQNENFEVDVLAGAFMMLSKEVAKKTKGFDETFFMYGEDIDLSYRVQKEGFKNYYFGEQTIIHFKGESTKRGSLNYVRMFYNAMSIFVGKHYSGSKVTIFKTIINVAIWFRALISLFQHLINKSSLLLFDALVVFFSMYFTNEFWINILRGGRQFDGPLTQYSIPIFTSVFILGALLSGIYDNLYKPLKALVASASAVVVLLAFYSLLPENYRFSRGVVVAGGILSGLMVTLMRWFFITLGWIKDDNDNYKQTIIVGSQSDYVQALQLMQKADIEERLLGRVSINNSDENVIGDISQLKNLVKTVGISEIIFCEGNLSFAQIIEQVIQLHSFNIKFRFHAKKSHCIVGSDSKTATGETLTAEGHFALSNPYQQRMKRMLDVWIAITLLATFPIQFLFINKSTNAFKNAWLNILGKRTWVGYSSFQNTLPLIPAGVLTPSGYPNNGKFNVSIAALKKADLLYAREYDWIQDLKIIFSNYSHLGT
ncbi:MAG: glycosyltransferase [Chitinophagaceae bacterium]